jgi:hypothetical protein
MSQDEIEKLTDPEKVSLAQRLLRLLQSDELRLEATNGICGNCGLVLPEGLRFCWCTYESPAADCD